MSEKDEHQESDYECNGCGRQFGGPWALDNHVNNCAKAWLTEEDKCQECGQPGCNGECFGDDMMGASS